MISKLLIHATALDFRANASLKNSINLHLRKHNHAKVKRIAPQDLYAKVSSSIWNSI